MFLRIAAIAASAVALGGCITPSKDYQGYIADEAEPLDIEPGESRSAVLAKLGTPSTSSLFDERTWVYVTQERERVAFMNPSVVQQNVVAIRFNETDEVDEILEYTAEDRQVVRYAAAETPTRGREVTILEQLMGNVGRTVLPQTRETTPGNPTGRQGR